MIILSTAYLAPVSYYRQLHNNTVTIEQHCNYQKQSYRNRCNIVTPTGSMALTIPVEKSSLDNRHTCNTQIAHNTPWATLHWRAIMAAYNSSPFFEYYVDDIYPIFERATSYKYLFDFNETLRQTICQLLNIDSKITYSQEYIEAKIDDIDLRDTIHPKRKIYQEEKLLPYYQVFSNRCGFVKDQSIIDLLFNMGNESVFLLKDTPQLV